MESVELSIVWLHVVMRPSFIPKLGPSIKVPMCRICYSCDIYSRAPAKQLSPWLWNLSPVEIFLSSIINSILFC